MAGYYPYELEELLESPEFEAYEDYEDDDELAEDFDEARKRTVLRRRPVRTARRGAVLPKKPATGYASKAELSATAKRLDARIATNSTAIKTIDRRLNGISTDHNKLRTDVTKLQSSINDVRSMSMLMPLLSSQKTRTATAPIAGTDIQQGDRIVVDSGDAMSKLLPLMLFSGGFGGSSSGGSGGMFGGGDSSGLMMVAMIMAMQK